MTEEQNIYTQLLAVQAELHAPKDETGRFGKSRSAEGILKVAKPLCHKHDLLLILTDEIVEVGSRNYVRSTAGVMNAKGDKVTMSAHAWEGEINRGLDASQVTGMAISYARKYALGGLFAIDDTKDADNKVHAPAAPATKSTEPADKSSEPLATPAQKAQVTSFFRAMHHTDDEIRSILKADYGIDAEHPMTAKQAKQVTEDLK